MWVHICSRYNYCILTTIKDLTALISVQLVSMTYARAWCVNSDGLARATAYSCRRPSSARTFHCSQVPYAATWIHSPSTPTRSAWRSWRGATLHRC